MLAQLVQQVLTPKTEYSGQFPTSAVKIGMTPIQPIQLYPFGWANSAK